MITKHFEHTVYEIMLQITTQGKITSVDIIGSLYNQLKEILKDRVSVEELVKSGKLGVISCDISTNNKYSTAKCIIPTNLSQELTCLLAAKCEQITKIGHTKGKVLVIDIVHLQKDIEQKITSRAKELEAKYFTNVSKHSINDKTKRDTTPIIELCPNVYSTPHIKRFKQMYIVEGRCDVKHLVYYGIKNVISMNGSSLDIEQLFKEKWFKNKEYSSFLDGDASAKKLHAQLSSYLTLTHSYFALKGKEVTDLRGDEIKKILGIKTISSKNIKNNNDATIHNKGYKKKSNVDCNKNCNEEYNKNYFSREEYFAIENYIEAIKGSSRIVAFDEVFGILFDEQISKLKFLDFSNSKYIIYDGLCENIFMKKIKGLSIDCIIAKGFSEKISGVECITFEEFEHSIIE